MDKLLKGYERFREQYWPAHWREYAQLDHGQRPRVMAIACADSRVDPAIIFDVPEGQMFTVRNVANLVPPYEDDHGLHDTSAALEFAVQVLKVKVILVLGHSGCGGCEAALHGAPPEASHFVAPWAQLLDGARAEALARPDPQVAMEHAAIHISLANLQTYPFVRSAMQQEGLALSGAHFSIGEGRLTVLDPDTGRFVDAERARTRVS